jgi:hypothetical protein
MAKRKDTDIPLGAGDILCAPSPGKVLKTLTPEARRAAKTLRLDGNQSALLAAKDKGGGDPRKEVAALCVEWRLRADQAKTQTPGPGEDSLCELPDIPFSNAANQAQQQAAVMAWHPRDPAEIRSELQRSSGRRGGKKSGENRRQTPEYIAARDHAFELVELNIGKKGDLAAAVINDWKENVRCPESQIRLWLSEWRKAGLIPRRKRGGKAAS